MRDLFDDELGPALARDYAGSPFSWVLLSSAPGGSDQPLVGRRVDAGPGRGGRRRSSPGRWTRRAPSSARRSGARTAGRGAASTRPPSARRRWVRAGSGRWSGTSTTARTRCPGMAGAINNTYYRFTAAYPDPADPTYRPVGIDHVFDMTNMPSYRLTIDMSDLDGARIVITTGQAGNPFDRHGALRPERAGRAGAQRRAGAPVAFLGADPVDDRGCCDPHRADRAVGGLRDHSRAVGAQRGRRLLGGAPGGQRDRGTQGAARQAGARAA